MKLNNFIFKINNFCVAAATVLQMTSCLDLDPQDQLGGDNMWATASEYNNFANIFYGWPRDFSSIYNDGSPHSDSRADFFTYATVNIYSKGTNTIPASDGNYTSNYAHIRRCNLLLQNAESFSRPEDIKQYVGEAYFFRAYSYFDLLQLYGDAIIVKEPIDVSSQAMTASRDDRSEVADFIIEDLNNAIERLPKVSELSTDEEGRVSKEAAQAFLSRVALYEGTWQKFHNSNTSRSRELLDVSANAAKDVINSKQFYLFGSTGTESEVLGDSAQKYMFILENEQSNPAGLKKSANHEYIFSKRHDTTLSPIGLNITQETVNNVQWVTRNFANLYLCDDGLPIDKSPRFEGYSGLRTEFQNRDNRMRYTLLAPGTLYWTNDNPRTSWTYGDTDNSAKVSPNKGSGYNNQKWGTERTVDDQYEGYDYPVIRYAEVLLNYAEAVYERDEAISDDDLNISLNLVRCRVNKEMPKLTNSFVSSNGLNMREEIRRERTVELYQEGFRLDDLKRWATAVAVMNNPLLGVKYTGTEFATIGWSPTQGRNGEGCLIMDDNRTWTERNYLYPIPSDQLQLNPNLKQNPGW